jgi:trimethylamine--corrinoid protein Co-methyltransferase
VNEETLALDTVRDAIESSGDFLGSDHTLQHFREDYYPRLLDRDNYDGWLRAGASSLCERARAHIKEILSTPATNLLTEEQDRAVQEIVDR